MYREFGDAQGGCPLNFLRLREHDASKPRWGSASACTEFLSKRLDSAHNLYRRDLFSHYGCVNALEFSQEGNFLVSGGDDRRVLLWNLEESMSEGTKPVQMKDEHGSNIFCLGFDSSNSKIFSAGNDEQVIVHDIKTREAINVFLHEEAIYSVSVNPFVDSVFASAGEDGQILIFDIRASTLTEPLLLARSYEAFHAVQFHPMEPMFVVTANSKEGVILWDVRNPRIPLIKYGEKRSGSSMCARFNSSGSQIIALRRRMHPILFNTHSEKPVCEFDADHYYNSCTMKSCCFAGYHDQFVLSGSDDFNLYMWRIPDADSDVNFVTDAHMILKGHRSIVNQVRFNQHNFTIASSGVEKIVKLWSTVPTPGSHGTLDAGRDETFMSRKVYTHEDYIGLVLDSGQTVVSHDYSNGSTDEDPKMMAFFDSLVQREVEGWTTNSDMSNDDDDDSDYASRAQSSSHSTSESDVDNDSSWTPSQRSFSPLRRRRSRVRSLRRYDGGRGNSSSSTSSSDKRRSNQGSEWILKLIAKKREQMKEAKLKKAARKKSKTKTRQFIRCFTSNREYLYQPETSRTIMSTQSNRRNVLDFVPSKRAVAPYTLMSLSQVEESNEEDEIETVSGERIESPTLFSPQIISSILQEVSDFDIPTPLNTSGNTGSEGNEYWSSPTENICDISNNSIEEEGVVNSSASRITRECNNMSSSDSYPSTSEIPNNGANSDNSVNSYNSSLSCKSVSSKRTSSDKNKSICFETSKSDNDRETSEINGEHIMSISGISTDEAGAVLFDSDNLEWYSRDGRSFESKFNNNDSDSSNSYICLDSNQGDDKTSSNSFSNVFNSLNYKRQKPNLWGSSSVEGESTCKRPRRQSSADSTLMVSNNLSTFEEKMPDLLDSLEDRSSSSSPCDEYGASTSISYGLNVNTPDSGISVGDKGIEDSSSELDKRESKPCFRKKKIPEFRMKSYRSRDSDNEEEEDDEN
ncbi:DDB1- and CUL4-associated factor 5 [Armadillidium nasatum]|uniref:DDB1-and CUL4-associated factor 5 n=1 Tax=Armadillidium nasatum TaxID=96803 RepID=A0A5N5TJZ2_9CRUS|nr:DDB1- and CUL4-associated factor 5 [Armadillidium nasatum]